MGSRLGLGVDIDRILAIILLGIGTTICVGLTLDFDGLGIVAWFPILIYCFCLWYSRWWSLLIFCLMSIPMGFAVYVICDIAPHGTAWGLLHRACESPLFFILALHGLIRTIWAGTMAFAEHEKASPTQSFEGGGRVKD